MSQRRSGKSYSKRQFVFGALVGAIGIAVLIGTSADVYCTLPLLLISIGFTTQADRIGSRARPQVIRDGGRSFSHIVNYAIKFGALLVLSLTLKKLWDLAVDRYPVFTDVWVGIIGRWTFAGVWLRAIVTTYREGLLSTRNDIPLIDGAA